MVNIKIRLIIFFAAKNGKALYSQQKQDWERTVDQIMNSFIAKFRLKLKIVGKITRPFRYHLNQIPYDYTVGVTSRLQGLDLIDRVPEELWTEVPGIVQEAVQFLFLKKLTVTFLKKKKCKKAKWLSELALQIAVKRRETKAKEKRKDTSM